jgi:hypothetical protein
VAPDARQQPRLGDDEAMAKPRIDWSKLAIAAVATLAIGLILAGFAVARTGDERAPKITDVAVEQVFPQDGDLVLRQSQVGVDLAPGYRGVLIIDGKELPTTDLVAVDPAAGAQPAPVVVDAQFDPAQNTVLFTPREGAVIESFAPGDHGATAVFWREGEPRSQSRSFSWQFKVS